MAAGAACRCAAAAGASTQQLSEPHIAACRSLARRRPPFPSVFLRLQVSFIPQDMTSDGKGPILTCDDLDTALLWRRVRQIQEIGKKMRETIRVPVHGAVERGLLVSLSGLRGFVPISHVPKEPGRWLAQEDLKVCFAARKLRFPAGRMRAAAETMCVVAPREMCIRRASCSFTCASVAVPWSRGNVLSGSCGGGAEQVRRQGD